MKTTASVLLAAALFSLTELASGQTTVAELPDAPMAVPLAAAQNEAGDAPRASAANHLTRTQAEEMAHPE